MVHSLVLTLLQIVKYWMVRVSIFQFCLRFIFYSNDLWNLNEFVYLISFNRLIRERRIYWIFKNFAFDVWQSIALGIMFILIIWQISQKVIIKFAYWFRDPTCIQHHHWVLRKKHFYHFQNYLLKTALTMDASQYKNCVTKP